MTYTDYQNEVFADSPLIYYTFETGIVNSGSLTYTQSGTLPDRVTYPGPGYPTGSSYYAEFNGTQAINCATTSNYYGDNNWSLEAWIKTDQQSSPNGYKTVLRRSTPGHVILRVRGSLLAFEPRKLELYYTAPGYGTINLFSSIPVDDLATHHVVVSCQNYVDCIMYVDKNVVAQSGVFNYGPWTNTSPQQIGREASNTELFVGNMDEVAIYDQPLSSTRVTAHYTAGTTFTAPFRGWGIPARR